MTMSRMQNILDKAERDGAMLRLRHLPDQDPIEAGVAVADAPVTTAKTTVTAQPAVAAVRTATPRRIDRSLVAAHSPDAAASRQYRGLCSRIVHADQGTPVKVIMITS